MKTRIFTILIAMLLCISATDARDKNTVEPVTNGRHVISPQMRNAVESNASSLLFIENKGQVRDQAGKPRKDIDFKIEGQGINVFIGAGKVHYQWTREPERVNDKMPNAAQDPKVSTYRMDVQLIGANENPRIISEEKQSFFEQYVSGAAVTRANAYRKVIYQDVYPNIDWVFYINKDNKLEHDFVVHPGGDVAAIRLSYGGATDLKVNKNGSLTAVTPMGKVSESAPYSYVRGGGVVASSFVLKNNIVSFKTAPHTGTLVIDPTLEWGTWFGLSHEGAPQITSDNRGNVFVAGYTKSMWGLASTNGYMQTFVPGSYSEMRQFLVKFDSTGQRKWATYYGNSKADYPNNPYDRPRITCDPAGYVYMLADSSLAKFTTDGQLVWEKGLIGNTTTTYISTYPPYDTFSLHNVDQGGGFGFADLQCDAAGSLFLSGIGVSNVHATAGTYQTTVAGDADVFLMKLDTSGNRIWGTYFGGPGSERISSAKIACDPWGNTFLTGSTRSTTGIATPGSFQDTLTGDRSFFLAKFNALGGLNWATYYGGDLNECDVATDPSGNVFLAGCIKGVAPMTGLASPGAFLETRMGGSNDWGDLILAKFDSAGQRQWATYYGGEDMEMYDGHSQLVSCDSFGNVYLGGVTASTLDIATPNSFQEIKLAVGLSPFIVKFDGAGNRIWGTYLGGNCSVDFNFSHYFDNRGDLYVSGSVSGAATNVPDSFSLITPGTFQPVYQGFSPYSFSRNVFLAKLKDCGVAKPSWMLNDTTSCANSPLTLRVHPVTGASSYTWVLPNAWTGTSNADSIGVTPNSNSGRVGVVANAHCGGSDTLWQQITIHPLLAPVITQNGNVLSTGNFTTYQWNRNGQPLPGATGATLTVTQGGDYSVTVTDNNGCKATSAIRNVAEVGINDPNGLAAAIKVFPNPAKQQFSISAPMKVTAILYSIDGKQLLLQEDATVVDISTYAEGLYLLKITDAAGNLLKMEKMIKTIQ